MTETLPDQTSRQQILEFLSQGTYTAREISQALGIAIKEVYSHLTHIARSAASQKKKLLTIPCSCLSCGHVFRDRTRFTKPGRCPRCRGERIEEPRFRVT
ncbi:MAG TPA: transcriptional regulator [Syntrophobacteria bacterium]|nr:transcriptional regulator [Syntrophobacteria bacterium]